MSQVQQTFDGVEQELHENKNQCFKCGGYYKSLGQHWRWNPDHRFTLTEYQKQLTTGLMLGDGCRGISYDNGNNSLRVKSINVGFLYWLQKQFSELGSRVTLDVSAENAHKNLVESGFRPNAKLENCHDYYEFETMRHPHFNKLDRWYGSEDWPNDIELSPATLKMWYVSDGTCHYSNEYFWDIQIGNVTNIHREEFIKGLFEDIGFAVGISKPHIRIKRPDTERFLNYIGEPVDGFEYKWTPYDYDEYQRLYKKMKSQPYIDDNNNE